MNDETDDIATKLDQINEAVVSGFAGVLRNLDWITNQLNGDANCQEKSTDTASVSDFSTRTATGLTQVRDDPGLGFPHFKIMDVLLKLFDPSSGEFCELHFSALVKQSRISKGRASGYLSILKEKGFIQERRTNYKTFYRAIG